MARRLLLTVLLLAWVVPLGAQEPVSEGLHVSITIEDDSAGILPADPLRASTIALLRAKLPEVVIDDNALLALYVAPSCRKASDGFLCILLVEFVRYQQETSPFYVGAEIKYWQEGTMLAGPTGGAPAQARAFMDEKLDLPIAAWLSLDDTQRKCWRDYFNANETFKPLSPC